MVKRSSEEGKGRKKKRGMVSTSWKRGEKEEKKEEK